MGSKFSEETGAALLLVIVTISILVVLTLQLIVNVNQQLEESDIAQKRVKQMGLLYSGLHLAQATLYADQMENSFDSLLDNWATINTEELTFLPSDTRLNININDLSGKLQINSLIAKNKAGTQAEKTKALQNLTEIHNIWLRFLLSGKFAIESESEARSILHALSDWIDSNEESREYGAESDYYSMLDPAYNSANDQVHFIEELLHVKGVSPKLLFGDQEHEAIADYITTQGNDGKININTAPAVVLKSLHPELTDEMVDSVLLFRSQSENQESLQDANWYKNLSGFPGDISLPAGIITVESHYFEIQVTATTNPLSCQATGTIYRAKDTHQAVINWHDE